MNMDPFRTLVRTEGVRLYRDLPWRRTRDPYKIWLSEVMLQQTQVARVETRWAEWLDAFPSVFALAEAGTAEVLAAWQGMGYNRRALALKAAAEEIVRGYDGVFPAGTKELIALPGIGPATAQGIRSFAFDLPGVYLETNVRTVLLHHLFPDVPACPIELVPLAEATCPAAPASCGAEADCFAGQKPGALMAADARSADPFAMPQDPDDTPRTWYYAMLDYGAYLKKTVPNPSRRAKHIRANRDLKAHAVRSGRKSCASCWMPRRRGERASTASLHAALNDVERTAGRPPVEGSSSNPY